MKYIYGPLNSRRLGLSLGISLTPYKVCDFDCIYCQIGKTTELTRERREYIKIEEIINELKSWFENNPDSAKKLNYITISGSGEPTLNIRISDLIKEIKKISTSFIAIITNASLLNDAALRTSLLCADLIVPTLNTTLPDIFNKICRPHPDIKIEEIIDGLISLRREFRGKIWLEVMLAQGINDDIRQIKKLNDVIEKINPDKIQLNSPVRSTTEPNVFPVEKDKLKKIKKILGEKCQII